MAGNTPRLATPLSLAWLFLHALGLVWLVLMSLALFGYALLMAPYGPEHTPEPLETHHAG